MRSENIALIVFKSLCIDTIRDVVYFPIWWYTAGLVKAWKSFINGVLIAEKTLAVTVWIKNIFRPMFGQQDITGRFISVFIRLLQIVVRTIALVIWVLFLTLRIIVWVGVPIIIVTQIIYQLTGGVVSVL